MMRVGEVALPFELAPILAISFEHHYLPLIVKSMDQYLLFNATTWIEGIFEIQ